MISYEEAFTAVMSMARVLPAEPVPLADACGRVLAQDVAVDMDMPPFNKSAMDGYACRKENLPGPLRVVEVIQAGTRPERRIGAGECSKIMTGAMIPDGADWVVMVEACTVNKDGDVLVTGPAAAAHVCYQGEDLAEGDIVLRPGIRLEPRHIALLAMAGCIEPLVGQRPRVGIIATGNELVEPDKKPGICQIRNSNSGQLRAQVLEAGAATKYYGIIGDTLQELDRAMKRAMDDNDIILFSGGVSMGDYDFVPEVLAQNGVRIVFDSIAMRPGKPTTFGLGHNLYCFGLPGNPVSAFLQCEILVKPLIAALMGETFTSPWKNRTLSVPYQRKKTDREGWVPVVQSDAGTIRPVPFHGSAHISALPAADGFMVLPREVASLSVGDTVRVWSL